MSAHTMDFIEHRMPATMIRKSLKKRTMRKIRTIRASLRMRIIRNIDRSTSTSPAHGPEVMIVSTTAMSTMKVSNRFQPKFMLDRQKKSQPSPNPLRRSSSTKAAWQPISMSSKLCGSTSPGCFTDQSDCTPMLMAESEIKAMTNISNLRSCKTPSIAVCNFKKKSHCNFHFVVSMMLVAWRSTEDCWISMAPMSWAPLSEAPTDNRAPVVTMLM
mmetsp:Transcript_39073/g.125636  ORF Transcript_39073/g.125636 Transcript_39073/m.125636 type:complete len:215 (-) Transcript_39073:725-1369(-)